MVSPDIAGCQRGKRPTRAFSQERIPTEAGGFRPVYAKSTWVSCLVGIAFVGGVGCRQQPVANSAGGAPTTRSRSDPTCVELRELVDRAAQEGQVQPLLDRAAALGNAALPCLQDLLITSTSPVGDVDVVCATYAVAAVNTKDAVDFLVRSLRVTGTRRAEMAAFALARTVRDGRRTASELRAWPDLLSAALSLLHSGSDAEVMAASYLIVEIEPPDSQLLRQLLSDAKPDVAAEVRSAIEAKRNRPGSRPADRKPEG